MRSLAIHHDGSGRYVQPNDGRDRRRLRVGDQVRVRVRTAPDAPVDRIFLRTTPDGEQRFDELTAGTPGPACRWWTIDLPLTMPSTPYRFLVLTADGHRWLNGSGLHQATPTDGEDFVVLAGSDPPRWLADRVFYQIFPDRFANGDPSNDVTDGAWEYRGQLTRRRAWDELPIRDAGSLVEFYGGDLAGVEGHLDHLVDLGVNAIYLNPVFATRSNHGYDITDYDRVADHFGGDSALVALRRATAERDIRLVLDIAPNHVGVEHPWFRDAQADPDAPTADFFRFRGRPDDYESWLGVRSLPKLDYRSERLRTAMYEGPDAVMRRWLRPPFAIDGWRIDVANMLGRLGPDQLGPEVARGMRAAVKAEDPDAYLLGEHSYDGIAHLGGDQWDAVMNSWGFQAPVLEWLHGLTFRSHASGVVHRADRSSTAALVETLTAFRAALAWSVASDQFNLLDSHDTPRIASLLGGDDGRMRAALGLLLTYVGVPSILYGDEVGLEGADDLLARRTMPWDRSVWNHERYEFVRSLVRLRTSSAALREGGFQVLETGEDSLAYLRDTEAEQAVVILVRAPGSRSASPLDVRQAAIADGTRLREHLTGAAAVVVDGHLDLPAMRPGVAIWLTRAEEA